MPLLETITNAITGIRTAKGIAEGVIAVDSKVNDADHNRQLAELNHHLAEILNALTDSMIDGNRMTTENAELKRRLTAKNLEQFKLSDGVYKKDGLELAFCPHCLHKDGTESVLSPLDSGSKYRHEATHLCPVCKHNYGNYKRPPMQGLSSSSLPRRNLYGTRN